MHDLTTSKMKAIWKLFQYSFTHTTCTHIQPHIINYIQHTQVHIHVNTYKDSHNTFIPTNEPAKAICVRDYIDTIRSWKSEEVTE